jgi:hypothetical protein
MPDRGRIGFRRNQLGHATWQPFDATAVGEMEKIEGKKDKRYTEFVSASPAAVCGSLLDPRSTLRSASQWQLSAMKR